MFQKAKKTKHCAGQPRQSKTFTAAVIIYNWHITLCVLAYRFSKVKEQLSTDGYNEFVRSLKEFKIAGGKKDKGVLIAHIVHIFEKELRFNFFYFCILRQHI